MCGSNESCQLGHRAPPEVQATPRRLEALDTVGVSNVACGPAHVLAVIREGAIASWGAADLEQTGGGLPALLGLALLPVGIGCSATASLGPEDLGADSLWCNISAWLPMLQT